MRQLSTYIILVISTVFFIACGQSGNKQSITNDNQILEQTGELIKIDFSDTSYIYLQIYAEDTVTSDGWAIEYFVKDDSSRYNDIYIKCSKGNFTGTFCGEDLLLFRRYFIPKFVGETESFIYFSHGCATDCSALLVFSKDNTSRFKDFMPVVDYSIDFNQVLCIAGSSYENEDTIYELALVDLTNDEIHKIVYSNICLSAYKLTCIDNVIFSKTQVAITTTLKESIDSEQEITQTRIIKL
jgi:hypothetical protein